jgi:hypothetical protein
MRNRSIFPRLSRTERQLADAFALHFLPMPDNQHTLLKLTVGTVHMSTSIETDAAGTVAVEIPQAILAAMGAWFAGEAMIAISRSFDLGTIARHADNGCPIPYKTVRAWHFTADGEILPLTAAEIQHAYSYDAVTGEPLEADSSEVFADAWPLDQ